MNVVVSPSRSSFDQADLRVTTRDGVVLDVEVDGDGDAEAAVVLCHGFVQNHRAWSVPSRSLCAFLVERGYRVYAIDLRGRRGGPSHHDLSSYTDLDAVAVVDAVAARHRFVAWIGHSMGGLIGVSLPAPQAAKLGAIVVLGSPLFPGDRRLHQLAVDRGLFRLGRRLGARGVPFPGRLCARGFVALRGALDRERFPWPVPLWKPGALNDDDLHHTLRASFADDSHHVLADLVDLVHTNGSSAGRVAISERLRALRSPLLAAAGAVDALAPPDSVHALFARAGSAQKRFAEIDAGHIDLVLGERAERELWPLVGRFLDDLR